MTTFDDKAITAAPFGDGVGEDEVGDRFGKQENGGDGDEVSICRVSFDENEVADDGDEDVEGGVEGGFDLDFAGTFPGGEDDEEWCGNDDEEGGELDYRDGFAEEEPTEDKVKDRGELDENAEIGGVVDFEGFVVENAGDGADGAGDDEGDSKSGGERFEVESGDGENDKRKDSDGIAVEEFL